VQSPGTCAFNFFYCINELHNITPEKGRSIATLSKWQGYLFSGGKWKVNGGHADQRQGNTRSRSGCKDKKNLLDVNKINGFNKRTAFE